MAIVVEDGTGVAGAETYADVVFADAYFVARPQSSLATTWAAVETTTSLKEGALREATAFVDAEYGSHYRGTRTDRVQGLEWPRTDALDTAEVALSGLPIELQHAVCELAGRAVSAPLAADAERGGLIKRLKAGSVEIEYSDGAQSETTFGFIEKLLGPILDGTEGNKAQWVWR